jgi:hypothetical protein
VEHVALRETKSIEEATSRRVEEDDDGENRAAHQHINAKYGIRERLCTNKIRGGTTRVNAELRGNKNKKSRLAESQTGHEFCESVAASGTFTATSTTSLFVPDNTGTDAVV